MSSYLEHKELTALRAMPISEGTKKLQSECATLLEQRQAVQPGIQKVMAKIDSLDVDKATELLTPLKVKESVIQAKLDSRRKTLFESVVSDSAAWMEATEKELDAATKNAHDTKRSFEERVKQNFKHADATMLLRGGNAAGSEEMREAASRRARASEQALQACAVRTLLDRQYQVDRVARGLAASGTGRPHVMPVEFHVANAAEICVELLG